MDQFGEHPEEISGIVELDPLSEDAFDLFFIIQSTEKASYYSLLKNENNEYDLTEISTSENSWINTYGRSSSATASVYESALKDINFDDVKEILIAVEIAGMTETADGDGMQAFDKIQFDVLSVSNQGITHNSTLTNEFNEKNGVKINEDSSLSIHRFLSQKYYADISSDHEHEKMEILLKDMDIITTTIDNPEHEFQPVKKEENGEFVIDLGFNFYECYFLTGENNFETHELSASDYPVFYLSDHGIYVYSIINIKIEDDEIRFNVERIYHQDEHSGEYDTTPEDPFYVYFKNIEGKWHLQYLSNHLMMKKDREDLRTINSNENQ